MLHRGSGLCVLAVALVAAGCGGGPGAAPAAGPTAVTGAALGEANTVVVRYDADGDGSADLLTLDTATAPFAVVEALLGSPGGGGSDATAAWRGRTIDPRIAEALADHLAGSFPDGEEVDLDLTDSLGRPVTVTVFE